MIRFPIMQKELKTQEKNTSAGKERPAGTKKLKIITKKLHPIQGMRVRRC